MIGCRVGEGLICSGGGAHAGWGGAHSQEWGTAHAGGGSGYMLKVGWEGLNLSCGEGLVLVEWGRGSCSNACMSL